MTAYSVGLDVHSRASGFAITDQDGAVVGRGANGFYFERGERLFLVTSRHVLVDEPSKHFPDRIEIEIHTDPDNLARSTGFSFFLYHGRTRTRVAQGPLAGYEQPGDADRR